MGKKLRIAWYTADTECLGPGKRFALWVQGCNERCPGCIAPSLQDINDGIDADTELLADEAVRSGVKGITISGGEPFLQAAALADFVRRVRESVPEMSVIVYTGQIYERLLENSECAGLIAQADLIIDGSYVRELDDGLPMRGSSNQRLIYLTNRLSPEDMPNSRNNKIVFTEKGFRMVGIPSKGARELLGIMQEE